MTELQQQLLDCANHAECGLVRHFTWSDIALLVDDPEFGESLDWTAFVSPALRAIWDSLPTEARIVGYGPPEMVGTERRGVFGIGEFEERTICTSHVERHNLTIRTLMQRFTRLSLGFSKKLDNLEAACAMFLAYYNYCWRTRYPDNSGKPGKRRPPATMLAGVTDHVWKFDELFSIAMAN